MIIGLAGGKGCGKSTVAKIIAKRYGYEQISFATPIKDMLRVLGLGDAELYDPVIKEIPLDEYGKSPRELLQSLGTEWGRMLVSGDVWIQALKKQLDPQTNYVIDDVRFENEAIFVRERGAVIHVERHSIINEDSHISEAGISEEFIDKIIKNISCYETDLELEVVGKMEEIIHGTIHNSKSQCDTDH